MNSNVPKMLEMLKIDGKVMFLKENLFLFHKKLKYPSIYNDKITTILTSSNHRKSPLFFKGGIFYSLTFEKIFPNFFAK